MHIMNISVVPHYSQAKAVVLIGVSVQIPGRKWLRGHVCEPMQDTNTDLFHGGVRHAADNEAQL